MVSTLPPFSQIMVQKRHAAAPFKRALRKVDQAVFHRPFDGAKLHVQAGVYLSRPWPFEVIAMAMLLEQQKRLERLLGTHEGLGAGTSPLLFAPPPQAGRREGHA